MTRRDGQPLVGGGMARGEKFYGVIKAALWIFFSILISLALARLA